MVVGDAVELAQAVFVGVVFAGNVGQCFGTEGGVGGQCGQLTVFVTERTAKIIGAIGGNKNFAVKRSYDDGFFVRWVDAFEFVFG